MDNSSNLVWVEDFSVHASDTDYRSQGKLSFILDIMQCAADFAVGNLGISVEEILNAGMGWMMITLDLDFITMEEAYRYQVRHSGLDSNGHLNNARYGDLCCDALTLAEWDNAEFTRFRITYLQEAKFGDELTILRSAVTDDGIYVRGQNSDTVYYEACIALKSVQ